MDSSKPEEAPEPVTKITDHMHPLDAWSAESRALIHRIDLEDAQSQESEMTSSKPDDEYEQYCIGGWRAGQRTGESIPDFAARRITALEEQIRELREAGSLLLSVVENVPISPQEYQLIKRFRAAVTPA